MRPIEIARKLNVSTSTLRNYEDQGLVPPTKRTSKGHRVYTPVHLAYFECITAMAPGFGMDVTSKVMYHTQAKDLHSALWLMNNEQASLNQAKCDAERNMEWLKASSEIRMYGHEARDMTIGEVSERIAVPRSTLRYWEKVGLIPSSRDPSNGYRRYSKSQLNQIMLLRTLRTAIYSSDVVELKQMIAEMNPTDLNHAQRILNETLNYLDRMVVEQMRGIYYVYRLWRLIDI